jgi:hypothetical protein
MYIYIYFAYITRLSGRETIFLNAKIYSLQEDLWQHQIMYNILYVR